MGKTHWKKLQNPDYLGAYSLDEGKDLILTIDFVRVENVTGPDNRKEDCTVIHFAEKQKPMIVNATNAKTITKLYKSPYIEDWHGRKIQIYSARVRAFDDMVEALRIRPTVPKVEVPKQAEPILCSDCKNGIKPFGKMDSQQMAQYTSDKYGKPLCSECAELAAKNKIAPDKPDVSDLLGENN